MAFSRRGPSYANSTRAPAAEAKETISGPVTYEEDHLIWNKSGFHINQEGDIQAVLRKYKRRLIEIINSPDTKDISPVMTTVINELAEKFDLDQSDLYSQLKRVHGSENVSRMLNWKSESDGLNMLHGAFGVLNAINRNRGKLQTRTMKVEAARRAAENYEKHKPVIPVLGPGRIPEPVSTMPVRGTILSPAEAKRLYERRIYGNLNNDVVNVSRPTTKRQLMERLRKEHPGITPEDLQRKVAAELGHVAPHVPTANLLGLNARAGASAEPNLLQFNRGMELEGLFKPANGAPPSGSRGGVRKSRKQRRAHRKSRKNQKSRKSRTNRK